MIDKSDAERFRLNSPEVWEGGYLRTLLMHEFGHAVGASIYGAPDALPNVNVFPDSVMVETDLRVYGYPAKSDRNSVREVYCSGE